MVRVHVLPSVPLALEHPDQLVNVYAPFVSGAVTCAVEPEANPDFVYDVGFVVPPWGPDMVTLDAPEDFTVRTYVIGPDEYSAVTVLSASIVRVQVSLLPPLNVEHPVHRTNVDDPLVNGAVTTASVP